MGKFIDFFKPKGLGFHLVLAAVITIVLILLFSWCTRIYTRHGNEIEMPTFIGQDADVLLKDSLSKDFIIVVSDYVYDKEHEAGTILTQNPLPNEKVKRGRKVYLTVASSVPPKVKMPALKDVSRRQAEIMLEAIGLKLTNVINKPSPYEDVVLEQLYKGRAIAPGTEISMGESITLVVGKDIEELPVVGDSLSASETITADNL